MVRPLEAPMTRRVAMVLFTLLALSACKGDKSDKSNPTTTEAAKPDDGGKKKKSNVITYQSPVPYGKHVACSDLVSAEKMSPYIGDTIGEVKDHSNANSEATAVCAFIRSGTPPSSNEQLKNYEKNNLKLGVLPGDEYCQVVAMCSYPTDLDDFKKKCEKEGNSDNMALGQYACVRTTERGPDYAYTYRVIDPDTKCIFEVQGGPSVTDETLVQNCTKGVLETIGPDNIKNFH
jgi:hypothetical protein